MGNHPSYTEAVTDPCMADAGRRVEARDALGSVRLC
jgi:hypothetical protein